MVTDQICWAGLLWSQFRTSERKQLSWAGGNITLNNNNKTFFSLFTFNKVTKNNMCEISDFLCFLSAGIPHVADLTKTDDVCSETRSDETNVRRSQEKVNYPVTSHGPYSESFFNYFL